MFQHHTRLVIVCSILSYNLVLTQPCRRSGKNCIQRTKPPLRNAEGNSQPDGVVVPGAPDKPQGEEGKPRKRCCPYDFDSSRCTVVDDRVLCGYNRNGGLPMSSDIVKELSDGCRLKNGRLECGYVEQPYINVRRPPAWDNDQGNNEVANENDGVIVQSHDSQERLKKNRGLTEKLQPNCVEIS